jgi:serine/threonine protein kinase
MCDLHFEKVLGAGGFGETILVSRTDGQQYAYKTFKNSSSILSSLSEIDALFRSKTRTLMSGHEFFENCVVGNYGQNGGVLLPARDGDLLSLLDLFRGRTIVGDDEIVVLYRLMVLQDLLVDILSAIECLHCMGYLHGDIKPENILYSRIDDFPGGLPRYRFFLSDFGGCVPVLSPDEEVCQPRTLTRIYSAPEVLERKRFTQTSDIYSMGLTVMAMIGYFSEQDSRDRARELPRMYSIFRMSKPFREALSPTSVITDNPRAARWQVYFNVLERAIFSMLSPVQRPSASDLLSDLSTNLNHPYPGTRFHAIECQTISTFDVEIPPNFEDVIRIIREWLDGDVSSIPVKVATLGLCLYLRYACKHHTLSLSQSFRNAFLLSSFFYDPRGTILSKQQENDLSSIVIDLKGVIYVDPLIHNGTTRDVAERIGKLTHVDSALEIIEYIANTEYSCGEVDHQIYNMTVSDLLR